MTLFSSHCVFHKLGTQRTIGTCCESGGIYHLERDAEAVVCLSSMPYLDIHCQLGHSSLQNLKTLVPALSHVSSLDYKSCQLSKHHYILYKSIKKLISFLI